MSNFNLAIPIILSHEGGLVNNPADPGGITNFGISLNYLCSLVQQNPNLLSVYDKNKDGKIDAPDIEMLTQQDATQIYQTQWWNPNNYGLINDQNLATKVFDFAVNMGSSKANELLQQASNNVANNNVLTVDGVIGNATLAVVNSLNPANVLAQLRTLATNYYENLVKQNPSLRQFLNGWLNRVAAP